MNDLRPVDWFFIVVWGVSITGIVGYLLKMAWDSRRGEPEDERARR